MASPRMWRDLGPMGQGRWVRGWVCGAHFRHRLLGLDNLMRGYTPHEPSHNMIIRLP